MHLQSSRSSDPRSEATAYRAIVTRLHEAACTGRPTSRLSSTGMVRRDDLPPAASPAHAELGRQALLWRRKRALYQKVPPGLMSSHPSRTSCSTRPSKIESISELRPTPMYRVIYVSHAGVTPAV